jgi:hypothetical protein
LIRWLTVVVGIGVAAGALYALLLSAPARERAPARRAPDPAPAVSASRAAPPLGEIDDDSRSRLEQVLRDAEREAAP